VDRVKLAVVGAGLIGKRHAERIEVEPKAMLFAIVDPSPVGKELAGTLNTAWFPNFAEMIAVGRPDGVIIATPNQLHLQMGLEAVSAGVPAIVEKPIADSVAAAELVEAAEKAGTPLLVGHHRRYNPMIREAKTIIDSGRLGEIVAVHGAFWAMKPDNYFDVAWRRENTLRVVEAAKESAQTGATVNV
jgi:predicted dehydrogenase